MQKHAVVSNTEWLEARKAFLVKEKQLTRMHDELSRERQQLPWEKVEKEYLFDGPAGKVSLRELFGGKSQLIVYHFMFGPEWAEGCPSCSMTADGIDNNLVHLADRDVSLVVVSRAPQEKITAFQGRMGWNFPWVSSYNNDFNWDYHVSFSKEEMDRGKTYYNYEEKGFPADEAPGVSSFYKDDSGEIFHTYSSFGRGPEKILGPYNYLEFAPKGRNEEGLPYPMAWVRHHDRYTHNHGIFAGNGTAAKKEAVGCCAGEHA